MSSAIAFSKAPNSAFTVRRGFVANRKKYRPYPLKKIIQNVRMRPETSAEHYIAYPAEHIDNERLNGCGHYDTGLGDVFDASGNYIDYSTPTTTTNAGSGSSLLDKAGSFFQSLLPAYQAYSTVQINKDRAKAGLPPIGTSTGVPKAPTPIPSDTIFGLPSTLVYLGAGIAGGYVVLKMLRRKRR